ncbi:HlyD family efflux transporter periplasmic adaptor subunit [Thalassomonas viridans]|uniref:HlyD family efflux transporter periplasmic adaptor subunit n=1 Tax=Thalassomonas viridans TaxID=137584 RepID=A0AAF0C8P8_9GAMM|nr:HlyD family efflux transporter periplasmic adaptor subunit [Thalassomonas viridans]WDE04079.1 HlyD family efflux transporter periplasmic adaptor subunit [Thalassomonas viridans]
MKIELTTNRYQRRKWLIAAALATGVACAAYGLTGTDVPDININELNFTRVQQGELTLYAEAYGEFYSAKERLLTAPAQGKVAEVLIRPGAKVELDTVILRLSNPRLEQELNQAKGLLAQQQAQKAAFEYEQQNERLNYQGRIADIEAGIEEAELELSVNQDLMARGVAAKIELQRAKLAVKQQKKRLVFEREKYQQLQEMQLFQLKQRDIEIAQQQANIRVLAMQYENMQVKAGISGTVQELEVELGQSVQLGQSLAKVGSDKELIARLRIPQRLADQIDLNARVTIDTQKGEVSGHISRIETLVNNGVVLAEAVLDSALTGNARPALPVTASIFMKTTPDALYINQFSGMRPHSTQQVFVRDTSGQARQKAVTFGELSRGKLLVTSGLEHKDEIITSNMEAFGQYAQVSLVQ